MEPNGMCCTEATTATDDPDCHATSCTIEVTNADVTHAASGSKGRIALTSNCGKVWGTGVACFTCTLSPGAVTLDIPDCEAN